MIDPVGPAHCLEGMMKKVKLVEDMTPVTDVEVRDAISPLAFRGYVLADRSWDYATAKSATGSRPTRWTDMALYAVEDPRYPHVRYVVQIVGRSLVYHATGPAGCRRGSRSRVADVDNQTPELYDALERCPRCRPLPLDNLKPNDYVALEQDRYSIRKCSDVNDLLDALRKDSDGNISGLGSQLLKDAAEKDADIHLAMNVPRGL